MERTYSLLLLFFHLASSTLGTHTLYLLSLRCDFFFFVNSVFVQPNATCGASCDGSLVSPYSTILAAYNFTALAKVTEGSIVLLPGVYTGPENVIRNTGGISNFEWGKLNL